MQATQIESTELRSTEFKSTEMRHDANDIWFSTDKDKGIPKQVWSFKHAVALRWIKSLSLDKIDKTRI